MTPLPPRPILFPYTTLFRSHEGRDDATGDPPDASVEAIGDVELAGCVDRHARWCRELGADRRTAVARESRDRSEEHTSELQSLRHLVCRLLLEKKNRNNHTS